MDGFRQMPAPEEGAARERARAAPGDSPLAAAGAWGFLALAGTAWLAFWPDSLPAALAEMLREAGATPEKAREWLPALAAAEAGLILATPGGRRAALAALRLLGLALLALARSVAARLPVVTIVWDGAPPPAGEPAAPERPESLGPGLPPLALAETGTEADARAQEEALRLAASLPGALAALGVQGVEVLEAVAGAQVATVKAKLPPEVRATAVAALADDLAVALGLPGLSVRGAGWGGGLLVEAPLRRRRRVSLSELAPALAGAEAGDAPLAVGLRTDGQPVAAGFSRAAHVLAGGETGGGKSVWLHSVICSLLLSRRPEDVRLVLADMKRVEFAAYEGIPHLLLPVVTEAAEARAALAGLAEEMERRYALFRGCGARDIAGYNAGAAPDRRVPRIVFIADELGDLMTAQKKDEREETERLILRLAQKARAAGIHLVLATQRPTIQVVTGNIKANMPSRIAFRVASETDSRVILDQAGAEALAGEGDGLASLGGRRPVRFQAAWVPETAAERIAGWWRGRGQEAAPAEERPKVRLRLAVPEDEEPEQAAPQADAGAKAEYPQPSLGADQAMPWLPWVRWLVAERGVATTAYVERSLGLLREQALAALRVLDQEGWTVLGLGPRGSRAVVVPEAARQAFLRDYPPSDEYRQRVRFKEGNL